MAPALVAPGMPSDNLDSGSFTCCVLAQLPLNLPTTSPGRSLMRLVRPCVAHVRALARLCLAVALGRACNLRLGSGAPVEEEATDLMLMLVLAVDATVYC